MTSKEFRETFAKDDVLAVLAQALSNENTAFIVKDLGNCKQFIRDKFLAEARHLINFLEKHNLEIIHVNN